VKSLTIVAGIALATVLAGSAFAAEADPAAVQTANDVCSKCHGPGGASQSALFPRLAGQQAAYIDQELKLFRDRGRGDPHARAYMWGIAGPLSDGQIKGLAEYFAMQPPVKGEPAGDAALAAQGKDIFEKGVPARDIPVCADCHGKNAEGNDGIPRLAGQHRDYLVIQMQQFRGLLRENETMHDNTKNLTDDDIRAVAEYLSSQ
jgi:cytochrome c553